MQPEIIQRVHREGQRYVDTLVFNHPAGLNKNLFRAVARACGRVVRVIEGHVGPQVVYREALMGEQYPQKLFRHVARDYIRWQEKGRTGQLQEIKQ